MNVSRQQVHELVDIINPSELNIIYHVLAKFIPEDIATPDEIEAIQIGRDEFLRGETVSHDDIDWD